MHRRCKQSWKYTNAEWIERYYIITSFSSLDDTQNICKIALLGYVTVNVLDRFWRKQRKERWKETALINRQSLSRTGERWLIVHDDVFVLYTLAWYRMFNIERLKILRDHSQTTPVYFRFVHASSLYRKYVNSRIYLIFSTMEPIIWIPVILAGMSTWLYVLSTNIPELAANSSLK